MVTQQRGPKERSNAKATEAGPPNSANIEVLDTNAT